MKKIIYCFLLTVMMVGGVSYSQPTTTSAAAYVYVTKTGKHYFYHRHNRGLNRAKKVYRVKLSTARKRGLTLAKTDYNPHKRKVTRKRANQARKKAKKTSNKPIRVSGKQIVIINHNRPKFSKSTLSRRHGA